MPLHHLTGRDPRMYLAWLRTTERLESIAVRERLQSAKVDVAGADWNGVLEPGGLNVERVRALHCGDGCPPKAPRSSKSLDQI